VSAAAVLVAGIWTVKFVARLTPVSASASLSSVCRSRAALSGKFHRRRKRAAFVSAASRCLPSQCAWASVAVLISDLGFAICDWELVDWGGAPAEGAFPQPPPAARNSAANSPNPQLFMRIAREVLQEPPPLRKTKPPTKPQIIQQKDILTETLGTEKWDS